MFASATLGAPISLRLLSSRFPILKICSERNENYHEIMRRIQFPLDICRGKTIMNHDYVFWCGDFNYRIDMANDQVKHLISKENWHLLAEGDQLHLQVGLLDQLTQ